MVPPITTAILFVTVFVVEADGAAPASTVPAASGSVIVRFVLVAGDASVNVAVPAASPAMVIFDMCCAPYTMVQTDPLGTVTVMPELIVTGPAVMAFLLEVME